VERTGKLESQPSIKWIDFNVGGGSRSEGRSDPDPGEKKKSSQGLRKIKLAKNCDQRSIAKTDTGAQNAPVSMQKENMKKKRKSFKNGRGKL